MTKEFKKKSKSEEHTLKHDTMITIGRVIKARGLYGEIKVEVLSNIYERFKSIRRISLELVSNEVIQFDVEYSRVIGNNNFLKLNGINNREEAENLIGAYIEITPDSVAPLDDNSYYIFDLEGMDVFDSENKKIGSVKRVEQYPSNNVIVIENETEEVLVPAIKEFISEVDIKAKKITVNLPAGLPTYPKKA